MKTSKEEIIKPINATKLWDAFEAGQLFEFADPLVWVCSKKARMDFERIDIYTFDVSLMDIHVKTVVVELNASGELKIREPVQ